MNPEGWLIEPSGKWLLLFHKDPKSLHREPQFYMDKWNVSTIRTPLTFINRRKVAFTPAMETWNELLEHGWQRINHHFGEAA